MPVEAYSVDLKGLVLSVLVQDGYEDVYIEVKSIVEGMDRSEGLDVVNFSSVLAIAIAFASLRN